MSANPLIVTSGGHSSASLAGAGLLDSGQALSESIGGGSWVEGGLAGFATTMDVVSAVTNPLGSLFSAGIGWVIEHFDPIKGWFDDLAGNAGEVDAFARTWSNIASQLRESGDLLQRRVNFDMAEMDGQAVTAYCTYATDVAGHLKGAGDWAESISKGLGICSTLVQVTHDLARDCLAEVVGTALGLATELALTVGLAAPHALHVISTKVSSLAAKLGKAVTKLLHSFKTLKALLKELGDLLKKAKSAFDGLPGGGRPAIAGVPNGHSPRAGAHSDRVHMRNTDEGVGGGSVHYDGKYGRISEDQFDEWKAGLKDRPAKYGKPEAQGFQHAVTGSDREYLLSGGGDEIWGDGVRYDPESGAVAIEAKYVDKPGGSSIHEGTAPSFIVDSAMKPFDDEMARYALVINDTGNPVSKLDIVTSTPAARDFLSSHMEGVAARISEQYNIALDYNVRVGP